jgi:hypothetical protein
MLGRALAVLLATTSVAAAEPALDEQVALGLIVRAEALYAAKQLDDAKQLAVEALVERGDGAAAVRARALIAKIDAGTPPPIEPDRAPFSDRVAPPARVAGRAPRATRLRMAGSGAAWGGVIGGLFADVVRTSGTTTGHVVGGAALGAALGGGGGVLLARTGRYTTGDVAVVDTLAGIGAVGGLTLGMLMQPVEDEAYGLNAVLGAAGGVAVGLVAAPTLHLSARRMARIAGLAAAGGAAPFLLYPLIRGDGSGDERLVGGLASAGLVGGALLGYRLTRGIADEPDDAPGDPPIALVGRSSRGAWGAGVVTVQPLGRSLAPQRGWVVPLVGGRF